MLLLCASFTIQVCNRLKKKKEKKNSNKENLIKTDKTERGIDSLQTRSLEFKGPVLSVKAKTVLVLSLTICKNIWFWEQNREKIA